MSAQPMAIAPTTPGALLDVLEAQGVRVGLRDGRLRLDAPRGVLTPELRAAVTAQRAALVALLGLVQPPPSLPTPAPARGPGRPTRPCYICRTDRWWQRPDGGWVCTACHPGPARQGHADSPVSERAACTTSHPISTQLSDTVGTPIMAGVEHQESVSRGRSIHEH